VQPLQLLPIPIMNVLSYEGKMMPIFLQRP
jgi:hypothetical protein